MLRIANSSTSRRASGVACFEADRPSPPRSPAPAAGSPRRSPTCPAAPNGSARASSPTATRRKCDGSGCRASILRSQGAVSEAVARAMARGALRARAPHSRGRRHGHCRPGRWRARKAGRNRVVLLGAMHGARSASRGRAQALSRRSRGRAAQDGALGARTSAAPLIRSDVRCDCSSRRFPRRRSAVGSRPLPPALGLCREARRVPAENYHMTLAFAGEVSREQAAALRAVGAAVRCPSFEVYFRCLRVLAEARSCGGSGERLPPRLCSNLHHALRADFDRLGTAPPTQARFERM